MSVSEWGGDSGARVPGADVIASGSAPVDPERSASESGNDDSGDLRATEWQPGDPVHVEPPRRQHCLNAGCGTTWVGADVAECPTCGGLVGQTAVSADPPLCALDESNDMEAFAALPECVLCGGTGKQIPEGFWGEEPVSEDDTTVDRVARALAEADGWRVVDGQLQPDSDYTLDRAVPVFGTYTRRARAAVRALREGQ